MSSSCMWYTDIYTGTPTHTKTQTQKKFKLQILRKVRAMTLHPLEQKPYSLSGCLSGWLGTPDSQEEQAALSLLKT